MFDIGWSELVLVGLVALIVIGPKELPTVLRTAGQWMGKVKRMASEFQGQFQEALREAEVADLKQHADDLTGELKSLTDYDPLADTAKDETGEDVWDNDSFEKPDHEPLASETTPETEPAVETSAEPAVADSAPEPDPAPAEPVAAAEPAPVTREDLDPAETPPPKQAGGSA